jgi:tripartite-type tricarboxylate transporter receptor subunit TctC
MLHLSSSSGSRDIVMSSAVRAVFAVLGLFLAAASTAHGEDFPSRYIRVIVGPGLDSPARIFGAKISELLGTPVVVEPRPGAGGVIAAQAGANAPPDGYTLLLATAAYTINSALQQSAFDLRKDFAPVGLVTTVKYVLVLHPSVPAKTIPELIAYAKANPGKLNFASPGIGTPPHLAGELFKAMAGIDIVHVPFREANTAISAVVSGSIQMMFSLAATAQPQIAAGVLRGLGVTSTQPSPFVPGIPTIATAGLPGFDVLGWNGFVAPRGTPDFIVQKLNAALMRALEDSEVRRMVLASGYEPAEPTSPEQFGKFIAADTEKWIDLVETRNLKTH